MDTSELIQGEEAWRLARVGSVGASRVAELVAKTKAGYGASRANLMAELICERLTGLPTEKFTTAAMQFGTEMEPEARNAYAFYSGLEVREVGLIRHPKIEQSHASPDGTVGEEGLIEIKVPQPAAHLETLVSQEIPGKYVTQMLWQLACTGRAWCDYCSYNPSFPENMRLFVKRVPRDDARIKELEQEVAAFLFEMATKMATLNRVYGEQEAA